MGRPSVRPLLVGPKVGYGHFLTGEIALMKPKITLAAVLAMVLPLAVATTGATQAKTTGAAQAKKTGPVKTVTLTGTDSMKYTPAIIEAKRGERIKVILKTVSALPKIAMAHNFVLPQKGVDIQAFITASATSPKTDYIAPAYRSKLIAVTKMAGQGETVETEFTAPTAAGSYVFVCTFPGHFQSGMKGQLVVK